MPPIGPRMFVPVDPPQRRDKREDKPPLANSEGPGTKHESVGYPRSEKQLVTAVELGLFVHKRDPVFSSFHVVSKAWCLAFDP